jgi:pyruvate kinase
LLKTKIICTMGPACDSVDILMEMIQAGMNVARLNMAHGELEEHQRRIENVREASKMLNIPVAIMLDIKGPEIRIGQLQSAYVLQENDLITLTTEQIIGDHQRISVTYQSLPDEVSFGSTILIDDGLIELKVESVTGNEISCRVINGGTIKSRKGVNLPGIRTSLPGVTEKDVKHILFGIELKIDMIAASFVRKAADILEIRHLLEEHQAGHIQIISKIENAEGVENLDSILLVSDGLMVARGDLGVEIPPENVPIIQKEMVQKGNSAGKPVIIATHMLDSMQINPRPTRAEASDVANAVFDGADVIMLSGESAAGKYPVKSVETMAAIAKRAESALPYKEQLIRKMSEHTTDITEIISRSVVSASFELEANAIITPTESGFTARMVSKYRPKAPIIAVSANEYVLRRLCLQWGVIPVKGEHVDSTDRMFEVSIENAKTTNLLRSGDIVVISAGVPVGKSGSTNLIKIQSV